MLRDYQQRAVDAVRALWRSGTRRVCLVMPTGAGKTITALALAGFAPDPLWVVHRVELEQQLGSIVASREAGAVRTIQSLLGGDRPDSSLLIVDECHHIRSAEWSKVAHHYSDAYQLGLTATPERADGQPLGDMYDAIVAPVSYSELIAAGHLVRCRALRPADVLDSDQLAVDPIDAWLEHAPGAPTFCYVPTIEAAEDLVARFDARCKWGALAIHSRMSMVDRDLALHRFRGGDIRVLVNVHVLTEGVDVPHASCCLLARRPSHASTYLQMVGRVLRPSAGKDQATLIDLCGASHIHGLPGEDLVYSLDGEAIAPSRKPTRTCRECATVARMTDTVCAECGADLRLERDREVTIYSMALAEVYAGEDTAAADKQTEWRRLVDLCATRGWDVGWALREYRKLFGESARPQFTASDKRTAWRQLEARRIERGYKRGWSAHRYRAIFGVWPRGLS